MPESNLSPNSLSDQQKSYPVILPHGYEFDSICGIGGFGILVKAVDKTTGHVCVLKLPHTLTLLEPSRLRRFRREIALHSRLDIPGIAKVIARGLRGDMPFLALDYYPLGSLASWFESKSATLTIAKTIEFGVSLSLTVSKIHTNGLVHRDMRPENLLVRNEVPLEVDVTDFGMATGIHDSGGLTNLVDCDGFLAPEITGEIVQKATPSADVWSLGIILAFLVWGPSNYLSVLKAGCKPLDKSQEAIYLLACIRHCTRYYPCDRYQNMNEVKSDLERIIQGKEPEIAIRHDRRNRFHRVTRRVALGILGVFSFSLAREYFSDKSSHEYNEKLSYFNIARQIINECRLGNLNKARELWGLHEDELRSFPFLHARIVRTLDPRKQSLDWNGQNLPEIYHVSFSPDGKLLASACQDGSVRIWSWSDRKPIFQSDLIGSEINMVFFDKTGKRLFSLADDGNVRIHEFNNKNDDVINITVSKSPLCAGCFHDDKLYVGDSDGNVSCLIPNNANTLWSARPNSGRIESMALKKDGKILAIGMVDGSVILMDASNAKVIGKFKLIPDIRWIDWDGNDIVIAGPSRDIGRFSGDNYLELWSWSNGHDETRSVMSLDSIAHVPMLIGSADKGKVVLLNSATGSMVSQYYGAPELVRYSCVSPDKTQILAVGRHGNPSIFNATRSQDCKDWHHPANKWVEAVWIDNSSVMALDYEGKSWVLNGSHDFIQQQFSKPSPDAKAIGFFPRATILWKAGNDIVLTVGDKGEVARCFAGSFHGDIYIDNEYCVVVLEDKIAIASIAPGYSRFQYTDLPIGRMDAIRITRIDDNLVIVCEDTMVCYSLTARHEIARFPRSDTFAPLCAAKLPSGMVCIGRRSGTIIICDPTKLTLAGSIQVSSKSVTAIGVDQKSGVILAASVDGRITTHDSRDSFPGPEWRLQQSAIVSKLSFSPDSRSFMVMCSLGETSTITIFD